MKASEARKGMIKLQYFNGKEWITISEHYTDYAAWASLGSDNKGYRTLDENGKILTESK